MPNEPDDVGIGPEAAQAARTELSVPDRDGETGKPPPRRARSGMTKQPRGQACQQDDNHTIDHRWPHAPGGLADVVKQPRREQRRIIGSRLEQGQRHAALVGAVPAWGLDERFELCGREHVTGEIEAWSGHDRPKRGVELHRTMPCRVEETHRDGRQKPGIKETNRLRTGSTIARRIPGAMKMSSSRMPKLARSNPATIGCQYFGSAASIMR